MSQEHLEKVSHAYNRALDDARVYKDKFDKLERQYNFKNNELERELRQTHAVLNSKNDVIKTMTTQMTRLNRDIAA